MLATMKPASTSGSLLVTGDENGVVGVWQGDARGRLVLICAYAKSGDIGCVVFRAPSAAAHHDSMATADPSTAAATKPN